MREKLLDLMKNEGLKPSQLADMLGINPAGISHILAGRNKPGFDLLQKILRRFPRISPDWLLLDDGPMYRNSENAETPLSSTEKPASLKNGTPEQKFSPGELFAPNPSNEMPIPGTATPMTQAEASAPKPTAVRSGNHSAAVKRIVILYEDDTFEAYFPTMR